jgi:hypothetical protein
VDERFIKPGLSRGQLALVGGALLMMGLVLGIIATLVVTGWHSSSRSRSRELADLAGEWRITYSDGTQRLYQIRPHGWVTERWGERRQGHVRADGDGFVLTFDDDVAGIRERLTLGVDGRLFVEVDDLMGGRGGKWGLGVGVRE